MGIDKVRCWADLSVFWSWDCPLKEDLTAGRGDAREVACELEELRWVDCDVRHTRTLRASSSP
jgi:hypothetical protein